MLPVGGRPILDWLIEDLIESVDEFIVVTNHKFSEQFEKWSKGSNNIRVIDDGTQSNETRLGAVRDIQLAAKGLNEDVLVMAGDNVLTFSLVPFIKYAKEKKTSCIMCHEENSIPALQKTAVITVDEDNLITSYVEKPISPKGSLAVPPFYYYRSEDIKLIADALDSGCSPDAPGSFAAWLSERTPMHAWKMTGSRHDIGDMKSYEAVRDKYMGPTM